MSNTIERSFNNLFNGKVFEDFHDLPYEGQKRVAVKTALVAAAAGLITGLVIGSFTAIVFAAIVGISAFSYFVTRYQAEGEQWNDMVQGVVKKATRQRDVVDEIIDGTVALYHKAEQKFAAFRNREA